MFRGGQLARVDERGRLKLPIDFKRLCDANYGQQFFITSMDGKRAEIYPMKVWEQKEEALAKAPTSAAKKKFLDITNYYGQVVDADPQGRLLLPQALRVVAKLEQNQDLMVIGLQTYLAVVNNDMHRASMEANPFTDDDLDALGAMGVR